MDIIWHGHACFTVRGKSAAIVIDPFNKDKVGLPKPKLEGDIVLVSHEHEDHSDSAAVNGEPYVIDMPGEYESRGVMIEGIPTFHDAKQGAERGRNTVFSIRIDGIHLVHLGDLGHLLDDEAVERIGDVDVLLVPVGGQYTIDAKAAAEIKKKLQPRITVPMHYDHPKLKLSKKLAGVDSFLKQAGGKVQKLEKKTFKLKASDLPEDTSIVVVFPNP